MKKCINKMYIPIFTEHSISFYTQNALYMMKEIVENEKPNDILGVSEIEYIEYLANKHVIDTPLVSFDSDKVFSEGDEDRHNRTDIFADPDLVFIYHLPFIGDYYFLRCRPNPMEEGNRNSAPIDNAPMMEYVPYLSSQVENIAKSEMKVYVMIYKYYAKEEGYFSDYEVEQTKAEIEREIVSLRDLSSWSPRRLDPEEREKRMNELNEALKDIDQLSEPYIHIEVTSSKTKQRDIEMDVRAFLKEFKRTAQKLAQDLEKHNAKMRRSARDFFLARKRRLLKQYGILQSIGYPMKKRQDVPETFAIPTDQVRKQIQIIKPMVLEEKYVPEPELHEAIYHDILKTMYDLGKMIERKPTVYLDKHEQALRDLFLIYLEPRYDGAATGETFNGKGKTDLLIRYQNSNVFVAECKVWHGTKNYLDGITQLLNNVVWRDSKAAIILFVKSEPLTYVCEKVKEITRLHSNYLGSVSEEKETWFNYRFHIHGDRNREVKLAVLVFWVPQGDVGFVETEAITLVTNSLSENR